MVLISMVMVSAYSDGYVSHLFGQILLFFGGPVLGKLLAGEEGLGGVYKLRPCDGDCTFVCFVGSSGSEGGSGVNEGGLDCVRESRPCEGYPGYPGSWAAVSDFYVGDVRKVCVAGVG